MKSEVVKSEEAIAENKDMVNSICNGHVEEGEEEDMKKNIPPASIRSKWLNGDVGIKLTYCNMSILSFGKVRLLKLHKYRPG